jgi:predicted nucleotidyltransferase
MNAEKKPENLADNLAGSVKYQPNPMNQTSQPQEKEVNKLKTKLEVFKKKILKKFPFTKVIGILPPNAAPLFEEDEGLPKEVIDTKPTHLIMIIPEDEYKNLAKIKPEVVNYVKESGENLWVHIKTSEVDLWNYGLDSKFEFLDAIAMSFPVHDNGFLGALRVAIIHKNLVLNWLNAGRVRYITTYAIGGSLVRGTADKTSDVDTFVIIDDTDVKRMSRVELLEKLRGRIVYDFIKEASALAGVTNPLNVQVYLLTDFWQSVKDAQPVMFTFIRDGIPLYDRGTFIPWKRLLQMGRIKPSPEAIDLYMKEGDRTEEIIKRRMLDAMVDIYFGVVTPTQAMMMLAGHAPPVPKTIVADVKKALVDEEKFLTEKDLKTLEKVVKYYKDYEHGTLKEIPGKEIDSLLQECKEYTKRMKELRTKLEKKMHDKQLQKIHDEVFSLMKKILGDKSDNVLIKELEEKLIKKGKVPERMLPIAKEVLKIGEKTKKEKITQNETQRITGSASELITSLTEYAQRKELVSAEKGIIQISFKDKKAEVVYTDSGVFLVEGESVRKIENKKLVASDRKSLEAAIAGTKERLKYDLPAEVIETLKKELGDFTIAF